MSGDALEPWRPPAQLVRRNFLVTTLLDESSVYYHEAHEVVEEQGFSARVVHGEILSHVCWPRSRRAKPIEIAEKRREQSGAGLFCLLLSGELFDFFHQSVDNLRFGNLADHFASLEDEADTFAAGDA